MKLVLNEKCDECDNLNDAVVEIGREPDFSNQPSWLCKACILKALLLFDNVSNTTDTINKDTES